MKTQRKNHISDSDDSRSSSDGSNEPKDKSSTAYDNNSHHSDDGSTFAGEKPETQEDPKLNPQLYGKNCGESVSS